MEGEYLSVKSSPDRAHLVKPQKPGGSQVTHLAGHTAGIFLNQGSDPKTPNSYLF